MMRPSVTAIIAGLLLSALEGPASSGPAAEPADPTDAPEPVAATTTQPDRPALAAADEAANLLPGITIDKARRRVMVACRTLRPGAPLELIACAPHTREHEAVLLVGARPQNIHLALLLCGFREGHPARWDQRTEQAILPAGDPVDVHVQWLDPKTEKERTVPIEQWLTTIDPGGVVPKLKFLFTGSQRFEDGRYWADLEGSVVSIANFPDAVIDLAGEQTRDNAMLEFKGNEEIMPPPDTACTMILLPPAAMTVGIDAGGQWTAWGRPIPPQQLADALKTHRLSRQDARVRLTVAPGANLAEVEKILALCRQVDFGPDRIDRADPPTTQPADGR